MDQLSLYELQIDHDNIGNKIVPSSINDRDKFVIDFIKNNLVNQKKWDLKIAELSIGDGTLSQALLTLLDKVQLTCVDISPTRIKFTRKMIEQKISIPSSRVNFLECNFDTQFHLLPSANFNIVIALDVMEHVLDVFNFVENCYRILKDQGILFLRVPNIAYIKHRIRLLFGALPVTASWFETPNELVAWHDRHGWDGGHLHLFTIPILYQLLSSYGFDIKQCRDPGTRFSAIRNFYPRLLYSNPLIIAKKNLETK